MYMSVCVHVYLSIGIPEDKDGVGTPGAGVTGSF